MELTEFITARLDEDETTAKAAAGPDWHTDTTALTVFTRQQVAGDRPGVRGVAWCSNSYADDGANVRHIARHDPARVLREVAAGRAILAEHEPYTCTEPPGQRCYRCASDKAYRTGAAVHEVWPCPTLRHLAAVWSDHPDYRTEWQLQK